MNHYFVYTGNGSDSPQCTNIGAKYLFPQVCQQLDVFLMEQRKFKFPKCFHLQSGSGPGLNMDHVDRFVFLDWSGQALTGPVQILTGPGLFDSYQF